MKLANYLIYLIFFLNICNGQNYIYQHFGPDEGLPSSEVYDIYQDKLGYIWFATDKGLSRYNGSEFENFNTKNGLPGNTILDFYPQKNGRIWCYEYHTQSLFYFEEKFNEFKPFKYNQLLKENITPSVVIKSLVIDKDKNIFVGGYHINGIIKISDKGKISFLYNSTSTEENTKYKYAINTLTGSFFSTYQNYTFERNILIFDTQNSATSAMDAIVLNKNKVYFIDKKLGMFSKKSEVKYYDKKENPICVKKLSEQTFFVGYYGGGAEIRNESGKILETFLSKKSITNFLIDVEGSYWFTTLDDGVYYVKNPKIKIFTTEHIASLVKDDKNNLFAGLNNSDIIKINKNTETLYRGKKSDKALVSFDVKNKIVYGYSNPYLIDYTSKEKKSIIIGANNLPENIGNPYLSSTAHSISKFENQKITKYNYDIKIQDICYFKNKLYIGFFNRFIYSKKR
ncbi:MAG: hypothetical protein HC854_06945 [Flavobacterium sp.]|nr:hypothetical protein [Flavobacterium sp.]